MAEQIQVSPSEVHEVLARSVLTDGMKLVVDLTRSRGSRIVDARNGRRYLDMYTFVATFVRVLGDPALPHLFFVEGGALAVENALKVAFDWKSRQNEAAGRDRRLGTRILHLTRAFHCRSGYTLSLTKTH